MGVPIDVPRASHIESDAHDIKDLIESVEALQRSEIPRLLLVEDNLVFAQVLERFFAKQGMTTRHAENGQSAFELLRGDWRPDLIVCDLHMPEMNGVEFVQRLRTQESLQDIPLVILTSDDSTETEVHLTEIGADGYLRKSDDPRLLAARVKRLAGVSVKRRAA